MSHSLGVSLWSEESSHEQCQETHTPLNLWFMCRVFAVPSEGSVLLSQEATKSPCPKTLRQKAEETCYHLHTSGGLLAYQLRPCSEGTQWEMARNRS